MTFPRTGRRRRILAAVALAAGSIASGAAASAQTTTPAAPKKVLRFALSGDENNMTPYTTTNRSGKTQDLLNLIYDTLLYSPFQEKPEPWLATSVERTPDNRTWTFKLRSGVTWTDGKPFTAEDVKFTFDYFFKTQQGRYSHHVNDRPYMESSAIVDPQTVRFTCREACPTFDIDPGADLPILPKHIWEKVTEPAKFTAELPVGTGPYKMVEHKADQSYRFVANEGYFKGKPLVDEIQMPIIKEAASMFLALSTGQVDAVARVVPPESLATLERAGLKIVRMADYGSNQINMNNQRPPFTEPKFRKAVTLAVDTDRISTTLIGDRGKPGVDSVIDPDSPFADKSLKHEFNPAKSKQTLDGLGMTDRNGDGTREAADGKPLSFEILVSSLEAREVRASELVASQLKDVGISVRVTALDPAAVNTRRTPKDAAGKPVPEAVQTGDYDMYVTSYSGGHFHFDPDGLLYILHCPGKTGFGAYIAGYCNPKFDELVVKAATLGAEDRKQPLAEAQRILVDEPPMISLYFPDGTFAYRPEAFSEWKQEIGHGIFHKRSFLPGPRSNPEGQATGTSAGTSAEDSGDSGGGAGIVVGALALGALAGGAALVAFRRRKGDAGSDDLSGPEVD